LEDGEDSGTKLFFFEQMKKGVKFPAKKEEERSEE
jgi:hypothetical protein